MLEIVHRVPKVRGHEVADLVGGDARARIYLHAAAGKEHGPEQAVGLIPRVDGRDLRPTRANLALKDVQSELTEGALVLFAVYPDVATLHKTHVGIVERALGDDSPLGECSGSLDAGHRHRTLEVGDLR